MKNVNFDVDKIATKQEGEEYISSLEADMKVSRDYVQDLKRAFLSKNFISITLAFKPSADFVAKLKGWFSENMQQDVILDLKIDQSIVGGAILICNNHYKDFSLGSTVDKYLK